ncbi:glycosyltransferase family 2 protein [Phocaeicola plebeius]|nr:glycosyltransferase family 2 protein [Phocaeicola plebeius]MCR8883418.1 glycosyltransferase family 2 protein [Phocaeicola plebeius]MDM8286506.1 glycosyltransferase family 2 protein [Phocaeicola plebeius]
MTLLVKNEEELLEQNLIFHKRMGIDGFIVTDNNSTDHTPDILRKYKELGWIKEVIREPASDYRQKKWVDRMVWHAKTIFHADWVINADADEFWYSPSGNLKSGLGHASGNVMKCAIRNMYPEEGKSFHEWKYIVEPVTDTDKYDLSPYSLFGRQIPKVMHRTRGYIQISMGNHKVTMFPKRSGKSDIRIYHYNIRGRRQFLEKMINGGKQLEQNPSKHGGRHWRYFYGLYKEGKLNEEYGRVIGSHAFDRLQSDGYIHEDHTMADFFKNLNK